MYQKNSKMFALILGLVLIASSAAADTGSVFVLHGVPGLPSDVDVYANGMYVDSFGFAESLGPLDLPPGTYALDVKLDGVTILAASATVEEGGSYSVIAHLTEAGAPSLSFFENSTALIRPGQTRLTVRHTAQAPTVDVALSAGGEEILVLEGLANSAQVGPLRAPAGNYSAGLQVEGAEVFNSGVLNLSAGTDYIVYAIGSYPDTFQLFIQTTGPERVAPFALER